MVSTELSRKAKIDTDPLVPAMWWGPLKALGPSVLLKFVSQDRGEAAVSDIRRGRMPVLVIERLDTDAAEIHHILIRNVGNGPALKIILGLGEEKRGAGSAQLRKEVDESCSSPLHLVPIPPDGTLDVAHYQSSNFMGVIYTDALGRPLSLKTSQYADRLVDEILRQDGILGRGDDPFRVVPEWMSISTYRWNQTPLAGPRTFV